MSRKNNTNNKSTRGRSNNVQKSNFMGPLPRNQPRSADNRVNFKSNNSSLSRNLMGDSAMKFAPQAMQRQVRSNRPRVVTSANGDCRVVHREFLQDVNGSVAFTNTQVAVNPGRQQFTPWLSKIARNYESYRFNKLKVLYETEAATTSTGTLLLSIDYDASDAAPTNKQQAMNYRGSVRTAPWSACQHVSLPEDMHKKLSNYVRQGSQPANTDIKEYDIGNLNISTIGQADASVIGEIYIEYDVSFKTPQYDNDSVNGGSVDGATSMSAANPFGTAFVVDTDSSGFGMVSTSLVTFTASGDYVMVYQIVGTTLSAATVTLGAGCTALEAAQTIFNTAATDLITVQKVRVIAGTTATVDYAVTGASVTASQLSIGVAPTGSLA